MNRLLSFWISPIAASLVAGFVATVIAVGWWSRVPGEAVPASGLENTNVFANVASAPTAAAQAATIPVMGDIALLGTVLPRNGEGARAVLRINNKPFVVEEGKEIVERLRLEKVLARSVKLAGKEGTRELEMLTEKTAVAASSNRTPPTPAAIIPQRVTLAAGCNATPAQRNSGIVLGSELLAGALQNSTGLATLLNTSGGKLLVQNSAGIGALIGLRDGDVLRTADGKTLTQANDLVTRVLQPVSQAQAVVVEITRDGAPQVLTFLPPGCRG